MRNVASGVIIICALVFQVNADIRELYNSKLATTDLHWTKHHVGHTGWEEVSSFDSSNSADIVRSYQVCEIFRSTNDNWIRSPFIKVEEGKRFHIEIEFSIHPCNSATSSKCKETFNIYYYEAEKDRASSTFPPWHEKPYVKIDTVAGNGAGVITKKTFSIGSISRKGFYIALQDQGACMSVSSVRVYYYFCKAVNRKLASFPATAAGSKAASLVKVNGSCVANAVNKRSYEPVMHCDSIGNWTINTGECQCKDDFQPSRGLTKCTVCPSGSYKLPGARICVTCPANSGLDDPSSRDPKRVDPLYERCPCWSGFARASGEPISAPCTAPPSEPLSLKVLSFNGTSAVLRWQSPDDKGGREDLFFTFKCERARIASSYFHSCPSAVAYVGLRHNGTHYYVTVDKLTPHSKYRLRVTSRNGASASVGSKFTPRSTMVYVTTKETAPSSVGNVTMTSIKPDEVTITWPAPRHPNGVITGYDVTYQEKDSKDAASVSLKTKVNKALLDKLKPGSYYKVQVRARTAAGAGPYSRPYTVHTSAVPGTSGASVGSSGTMTIVAAACGIVLVVVVLALIVVYRKTGKLLCLNTSRANRKKQQQLAADVKGVPQMQPLIVDLPPKGHRIYVDYPDPHKGIAQFATEINSRDVIVENKIGTGEFAEVCRGRLQGTRGQGHVVAVKRLKQGSTKRDQRNFLREASTMAQFNDPNIVQLKGVVTKAYPYMIITEYMENKSLDNYLELQKGQLSILQLVEMLKGIASGMRYLSSMKYVHRDLAARNILVNSELVCKVSDFGLSRTLENDPHATYTTQGGKIAIRWTAPECIHYREFTTASDVWSYGIVMWEVMSYGQKPYWDMSNQQVMENVDKGMRLPSPTGCPKVLHELMLACWSAESSKRPPFTEIVRTLDSLLAQPEQLNMNVTSGNTVQRSEAASFHIGATPNLSRAMDNGQVNSVRDWLELQRLSGYSDQFQQRGIDNLEKVSNLTINDLKNLGINVTLHMDTLENGIRTLRRHLSTASSTPCTSARTSNISSVMDDVMEGEEPSGANLESAAV